MTEPIEARAALHEWIVRTTGKIRAEELSGDTPLLERRIVSSLEILDLILFLEQLRGKAIDVSRIAPGSFRDLDTICARFLEPEPAR